jgi:hypothetical protein
VGYFNVSKRSNEKIGEKLMGWISMWQYVYTEHFEGALMFGLLCNERHKIRLCTSSFVVTTATIVSRANVWKWQC